jgi:hypothetical protein
MLYAFLDASSHHANAPVMAISGFVVSEPQLEFEDAWRGILDKQSWPSRLTEFHMVDCCHGQGEFFEGRWTFANRLALYGELLDVISNYHVFPVSASVISDCFSELSPRELTLLQGARLGTPLELTFQFILQQILFTVKETAPGEQVVVISDHESRPIKNLFQSFAEEYAAAFLHGDVFNNFEYMDSKDFGLLQAADLFAFGTVHYAHEQHSGLPYRKPDLPVLPGYLRMLNGMAQRLAALDAVPKSFLYDREALTKLVEKIRQGDRLPKRSELVTALG